MKAQFINPDTNKAVGRATLARDIAPTFRDAMYPASRLGRPVLRTPTYPALFAPETRALFNRLVAYADLTGWIVRVEMTKREHDALRIPPGKRGMSISGDVTVYPGSPVVGRPAQKVVA